MKYNDLKVAVLGDGLLDIYRYCDVTRLAPEAPVPVLEINSEEKRLGGALNVASICLSLGAKVSPLIIADDIFIGQPIIQNMLRDSNLDDSLIYASASQISYKYRYVTGNKLVARADCDSSTPTPRSLEIDIISKIKKLEPHLIIMSDYNKGTLTPSLVTEIIRYSNESNIIAALDPKPRTESEAYIGVTVMTPNLPEAMSLCGLHQKISSSCIGDKVISDVLGSLNRRFKPKYPMITLGKEGSAYFDPSNSQVIRLPASPIDVYDVTGAGDILISVLGLELSAGESIERALALSVDMATMSVGQFGNYIPSQTDLAMCIQGVSPDLIHDISSLLPLNRGSTKLVFTNGCFDVLHYGHLHVLREAKKRGDILVVGLNTDSSIKRLKGESRPINNYRHRYELLKELGCVDYVIPFDDDTPIELIRYLQPDLLVKGGDYRIEDIVGVEYCAETIVVPYLPYLSTTNTISKLELDPT